MINLTIDGKQVEVPEGTTVLRAAEKAGIKVPKLCDHPQLVPTGGCRLCIVDVQGFRVPMSSCTLPASNGMIVKTDSEALRKSRQTILSLLFSERNHFCPFCQLSGGDCELQNAAYDQGMTHWPMQPGWKTFPVDTSHDYFILDNNRCILCRRCVRACSELVGNYTLGIAERGSDCMLVADANVPLGDSSCVSCGVCLQVCPTGALIDRQSAYYGHEKQLTCTESTCVGCSVGCGINVLTSDNRLVRIEGNWNAPVNGGLLCKIGKFDPVAETRSRITTPLVRKNGKLEPASWEEALEKVAQSIKPLVGKKGNGVAALASTRLPAESLALFKQLFADQIQSDMVTSLEEGQPSALPAALADELGLPFEGSLDILRTADCTLAIGVNLVENHQVAGFFLKRNVPLGSKLIVVDPQENGLDELAAYILKANAGSDLDVIEGLQAAIVNAKMERVPAAPINSAKVLAEVNKKTGLAEADVTGAAQALASAAKPVIVYGKGITANGNADTLKALVTLAKITGASLISIKGEANSLAAAQYHLDRVFELNGHQAVYVALGDDTPSQRLIDRLAKAPFLAVQTVYHSPLTEMAQVVLPVTRWIEQDGHYLSLDGRLQMAHKAMQAPANVWVDEQVFTRLAGELGLALNGNDGSDRWKELLFQRVAPVKITEN
jgi:formate dehydrogenase major subunit